MKPYGLPRNNDVACPDCVDINYYGLKSSKSRVAKYGVIKNSFRSVKTKASVRRIWKRKARIEGQKEITKALTEV